MAEPLILALDQGTTSTRCIVFTSDGRSLSQASRPLGQAYPRPGWVEHDPEEIFTTSVAVMRDAIEQARCGRVELAALGIANQRETTIVWERASGRAIHPAIVWQDRRTAPICERLKAQGLEPGVVERTGLLLDAYFSGTKISWILDHVEGARARAERGELLAGTVDSWLVWRLTAGAVHATDATNASRTLLMELERQQWSDELCGLLGVPRAMLPEIRDTSADYGRVSPDLLGLDIPIRAVVGDQQAALMGHGCIGPGSLKATYGTGCFALLNTGEAAPRSRHKLLTTVAMRVGGRATYALEGSIFVAGAAIQWVEQGLGVDGGPEAVEALARAAKSDHGVALVPAFTGLGAPHWDADARGAVLGLTRDSGLAEIAAAAFDACALQTRDLLDAMRADAPHAFQGASKFRIDGGMAKSAWFCQRLADLTGLSVDRSDYAEATALGAAMFAGLGAGLFSSIEAAAGLRPGAETLQPTLPVQDRDAAHARWREAVMRVRSRPQVTPNDAGQG